MNDTTKQTKSERLENGADVHGRSDAANTPREQEADLSVFVDAVFGESRSNGVIINTGGGGHG